MHGLCMLQAGEQPGTPVAEDWSLRAGGVSGVSAAEVPKPAKAGGLRLVLTGPAGLRPCSAEPAAAAGQAAQQAHIQHSHLAWCHLHAHAKGIDVPGPASSAALTAGHSAASAVSGLFYTPEVALRNKMHQTILMGRHNHLGCNHTIIIKAYCLVHMTVMCVCVYLCVLQQGLEAPGYLTPTPAARRLSALSGHEESFQVCTGAAAAW